METSIQKQRKALKQSITQYVASNNNASIEIRGGKLRSANKRITLNSNLTALKHNKGAGKRSETMRGMLSQDQIQLSEMVGGHMTAGAAMTEYSRKDGDVSSQRNFGERPGTSAG